MKILNLYAGIGGNRKLWGDEHEITAVEWDKGIAKMYSKFFSNDVMIVADAHQYLVNNYKEFDFIWSSPPCPTHSRVSINFANAIESQRIIPKFPDMKLYEEIIFLKHYFKGKWIVENVIPYYTPLIQAKEYDRHLFWSNFNFNKKRQIKAQHILRGSTEDAAKIKGVDLKLLENVDKRKVINNAVKPETGLYILNCAMNIITKENVNQLEINYEKTANTD